MQGEFLSVVVARHHVLFHEYVDDFQSRPYLRFYVWLTFIQ